jgi:hypothetical protein
MRIFVGLVRLILALAFGTRLNFKRLQVVVRFQDEKAVEESLKVWYGIGSNAVDANAAPSAILTVISAVVVTRGRR